MGLGLGWAAFSPPALSPQWWHLPSRWWLKAGDQEQPVCWWEWKPGHRDDGQWDLGPWGSGPQGQDPAHWPVSWAQHVKHSQLLLPAQTPAQCGFLNTVQFNNHYTGRISFHVSQSQSPHCAAAAGRYILAGCQDRSSSSFLSPPLCKGIWEDSKSYSVLAGQLCTCDQQCWAMSWAPSAARKAHRSPFLGLHVVMGVLRAAVTVAPAKDCDAFVKQVWNGQWTSCVASSQTLVLQIDLPGQCFCFLKAQLY